MFKKISRIAAMLLASALIFTACGNQSADTTAGSTSNSTTNTTSSSGAAGSANAIDSIELGKNGPVAIEFWHIQATIYGDAIKEMIAAFNKEYEGKIKVNEVFQGDYGQLNQKIKAALQGGGLPNVAMAYENETGEYMKSDVIVPLDDYINSTKYGLTQQELDDMLPAVLARQRLANYGGKTMSWPHGNSAQGVYYNVDLLGKAGYDAPAKTWDEFEKQCTDIYNKTGVPALAVGSNPIGSLLTWIRTYGVTPIEDDSSKVDFDNAATISLLNMMKHLIDSGAAYKADNTENDFTGGKAAMEISTTARTSSKVELIGDKFKWNITLIPQGKQGVQNTSLYGGNQVMFKATPEKQLASWVFLKYFAGPSAQAIYGARTGYFPATKSSLDQPVLKDNYTKFPQKMEAFQNVFPYGIIDSPSPARSQISDVVLKQAADFFSGKRTAEQTAKLMQSEAENALAKYK